MDWHLWLSFEIDVGAAREGQNVVSECWWRKTGTLGVEWLDIMVDLCKHKLVFLAIAERTARANMKGDEFQDRMYKSGASAFLNSAVAEDQLCCSDA